MKRKKKKKLTNESKIKPKGKKKLEISGYGAMKNVKR